MLKVIENGLERYTIDENGRRQGECFSFYLSGGIKAMTFFVNDEVKYRELRYENGFKKQQAYYENNLRSGEYKRWDENGHLIAHSFYDKNLLVGECMRWYAMGRPEHHGFFLNGVPHGECKDWTPNGDLMHSVYADGNVVVEDATSLTDKDKFVLTLRYPGVRFLP